MFEKVLKDPVHDEILFDHSLIWSLVNTSAVQRLRRIRQLGTSYMTFHGAEHTRFAHSLGAYETMRRVLLHLERECGWPSDERDTLLALSAALLHDVGHGPFSHTFESVLGVHHERWTKRIIMEDPSLRSILDEVDSNFAKDLVSILNKDGKFPCIEALVSSQLDVDRMDYMLRDAMATGVSYGQFELTRLVRSLTYQDGHIYVKRMSLHTVEQYLLARYFMYVQVYLHPVTVGSDVLVEKIITRVRDLLELGHEIQVPPALLSVLTGGDSSVEAYLRLDESVLIYAFHLWSEDKDEILSDLATRFLNRKLFAPVVRDKPSVSEWASLRTIAKAMGFHPDYYVTERVSHIPGYEVLGQGITLVDNRGEFTDLSQVSKLIRTLVPSHEHRLFLPKEMLESGSDPMSTRVKSIIYDRD
ncbi:HD domain-containing protein [Alicyclobacillus dauci]|uniref:HD domain-containing protein n=1 Tax=Alicyclobacillus dauci TaxID=1475485 RepID=A0ABY6YYT1_9BACL|nr:HD domain-containing protein [Alicyclobacillus dauci]WAH35731.1 HD domain-containing protein [Alicyclobacillus dauci]